jgi:hypothetical protein
MGWPKREKEAEIPPDIIGSWLIPGYIGAVK